MKFFVDIALRKRAVSHPERIILCQTLMCARQVRLFESEMSSRTMSVEAKC